MSSLDVKFADMAPGTKAGWLRWANSHDWGAAGLDEIGDWGGQRKPKTKDRILSALRAAGRSYELVYNAAHGRRYRLAVWPAFADLAMAQAARRAAIAAANELGATLAYEMGHSA